MIMKLFKKALSSLKAHSNDNAACVSPPTQAESIFQGPGDDLCCDFTVGVRIEEPGALKTAAIKEVATSKHARLLSDRTSISTSHTGSLLPRAHVDTHDQLGPSWYSPRVQGNHFNPFIAQLAETAQDCNGELFTTADTPVPPTLSDDQVLAAIRDLSASQSKPTNWLGPNSSGDLDGSPEANAAQGGFLYSPDSPGSQRTSQLYYNSSGIFAGACHTAQDENDSSTGTSYPNMNIDYGSEVVVHHDIVLGKGASSTVYQGEYRSKTVAVKMITEEFNDEASGPQDLSLFQQEVQLLSSVRHPSIVKLYGCCLRQPFVFIVEELMHTTLHKALHESHQHLTLKQALGIALDIARGLEHLHMMSPPIIHRDLKPDNILLDAQGHAKISDFGLARCKYQSCLKTARREAGTLIYMSPECFDPELGKLTEKVDIFSFGVICWELITRQIPWQGLQMYEFLQRVVVDGARLPIPADDEKCPFAMRRLIQRSWSMDPDERPHIGEIVQELSRMHKYLS